MLSGLELNDTYFYGRHVSNIIPVYGILPEKKDEMLTVLKNGLNSIKAEYLDAHLKKGTEGNITFFNK